jgi:hypothetical protein
MTSSRDSGREPLFAPDLAAGDSAVRPWQTLLVEKCRIPTARVGWGEAGKTPDMFGSPESRTRPAHWESIRRALTEAGSVVLGVVLLIWSLTPVYNMLLCRIIRRDPANAAEGNASSFAAQIGAGGCLGSVGEHV